MTTEIVKLYITSEDEKPEMSSFATVGDTLIHCTRIQNGNQVVLTINPDVTAFGEGTTELTWSRWTRFQIFDVHQPQTQSFTIAGRKFEIDFLTWSQAEPGTLRFDFEVRYEAGASS